MIYFQLFLAFLQIGAFSFGGGYAAMPLIQAQVIEKCHWLTLNDFTNLITIAEMTPGPIAVNSSTFVGNQVAGIPGAIVATIGCILPSCIFVTILAKLYAKYRNLRLIASPGCRRHDPDRRNHDSRPDVLRRRNDSPHERKPANPLSDLLCSRNGLPAKSQDRPHQGHGLLWLR